MKSLSVRFLLASADQGHWLPIFVVWLFTTLATLIIVVPMFIIIGRYHADRSLPTPRSPQIGTSWSVADADVRTRNVEHIFNDWLGDTLKVSPAPVWYHVSVGQSACGTAVKSKNNFYCFKDMTVYMMNDASSWSPNHSLGITYIVGHEGGHHLQALAGNTAGSPPLERQANCVGGVFVKWAVSSLKLAATDAEVQEMISGMRRAPSDEVHGSVEELANAFEMGYAAGSLNACAPIAGPFVGA